MQKIIILLVVVFFGAMLWTTSTKKEVLEATEATPKDETRVLRVDMNIDFPGEEHSARVISYIFFNSTNAHEAVRITELVTISNELTVSMLGTFLDGEMKNLYVCSLNATEGCIDSDSVLEVQKALAPIRERMIIYYDLYQQRLEEEMKKRSKTPEEQQPKEEAPEKIIV